jgi:hypothetical protein
MVSIIVRLVRISALTQYQMSGIVDDLSESRNMWSTLVDRGEERGDRNVEGSLLREEKMELTRLPGLKCVQ